MTNFYARLAHEEAARKDNLSSKYITSWLLLSLSQGELIGLLGNLKDIINRLERQKAAIDKAIAALGEFDDGEIAETEGPKSNHAVKAVKKAGKKRVMSPEGRKRIAEASKRRWAAVRKAAAKKAA
jgi:hypothetical protein